MKLNDQRNFVHKRIGGAIGGLLTGGVIGAVAGFVRPSGRRGGSPTPPGGGSTRAITEAARCNPRTQRYAGPSRGCVPIAANGGNGSCTFPLVRVNGLCVSPGSPASIDVGSGQAVMGQYGAAMIPMSETRFVHECLPGMVLGKDNLCYNKRDLSNKERKYPRGTRPLGTPGEMAALRKAASFGRRMETTIKRMQKIGVIKRPAPRRTLPRQTTKMLAPGVVQIQQE